MSRLLSRLIAPAFSLALIAGQVAPLSAQSREEVKFAQGNDNAAIEGTITGNEYKDYVLGARAGQTMSVSLITGKRGPYFNILPPGSDGVAIYNGSSDGPDASIKLPQDGDYTIRVYLMGDAKDSNKTKKFTLSMTIM